MSGITFLTDNYVDNATLSLTTGTENAQFPLSNLSLDFTTKKFRSTGNTVVILIDFLVTRTVNSIALAGDATSTLGTSAASVKLSLTTDFTSSTANELDMSAEFNMGTKFIEDISARYAEVTLTGTGSYCEIGKLYIGDKLNLPYQSISIDSFNYRNLDNSEVSRNTYGQKFIDRKNITKRISGSIQYCNKVEQESLDDLYLEKGRNSPIWIILDETSAAMNSGKYRLTMYGYFNEGFTWSANGGQTYTTPVSMEQVI